MICSARRAIVSRGFRARRARAYPPNPATASAIGTPSNITESISRKLCQSGSSLKATQVWLWGQGSQPVMTPFRDLYGVSAGLCTAVDLVRP